MKLFKYYTSIHVYMYPYVYQYSYDIINWQVCEKCPAKNNTMPSIYTQTHTYTYILTYIIVGNIDVVIWILKYLYYLWKFSSFNALVDGNHYLLLHEVCHWRFVTIAVCYLLMLVDAFVEARYIFMNVK